MLENVSREEAPSSTGFRIYAHAHGLLEDLVDDNCSTRLSTWKGEELHLAGDATHYGYVYDGTLVLESDGRKIEIGPGMYFSSLGNQRIHGSGRGIAVSRYDHRGFFLVGGPVEQTGRLRYIDGCTDSLLIPPILNGDPCLNLLHFPPYVDQTTHTHPSMRAGMIVSGRGECVVPDGVVPLNSGDVFMIPAESLHAFRTAGEGMRVVAYHPDSDFGPTHEFHPMINRTMVGGVSASFLEDIRTKPLGS